MAVAKPADKAVERGARATLVPRILDTPTGAREIVVEIRTAVECRPFEVGIVRGHGRAHLREIFQPGFRIERLIVGGGWSGNRNERRADEEREPAHYPPSVPLVEATPPSSRSSGVIA
jgi:hypothetical protein